MRKRGVEYSGLFAGNTLVLAIFGLAVVLMMSGCSLDGITGEAKGGLSATNVGQGVGLGSGGKGGGKVKAQCSDGIDNDGDGYCDYLTKKTKCTDGSIPGDVDCASKNGDEGSFDCISACDVNSACGANLYVGGPYCETDGNVYKDFESYTCENAGQCNAVCNKQTNGLLITNCAYGCTSGSCNAPPYQEPMPYEDPPPNDDPIPSEDVGGDCSFAVYSETAAYIGSFAQGPVATSSFKECDGLIREWKADVCQYKGIHSIEYRYSGYIDPLTQRVGSCCCTKTDEWGQYCAVCTGDLPPIPEGNDPDCGSAGCGCELRPYSGRATIGSLIRQATVFSAQECQVLGEQWKENACQYEGVYTNYLMYVVPAPNALKSGQIGIPGGDCCCVSGGNCIFCPGDLPPIPEGNDPDCDTTGCSCSFSVYDDGSDYVSSLSEEATVFSQQECQQLGEVWKANACQYDVYSNKLAYKAPSYSFYGSIGFTSGPCCCTETNEWGGTSCVRCSENSPPTPEGSDPEPPTPEGNDPNC